MWTANSLRRFPLPTAFIADAGGAVVEAGYPLNEHYSVRLPVDGGSHGLAGATGGHLQIATTSEQKGALEVACYVRSAT